MADEGVVPSCCGRRQYGAVNLVRSKIPSDRCHNWGVFGWCGLPSYEKIRCLDFSKFCHKSKISKNEYLLCLDGRNCENSFKFTNLIIAHLTFHFGIGVMCVNVPPEPTFSLESFGARGTFPFFLGIHVYLDCILRNIVTSTH